MVQMDKVAAIRMKWEESGGGECSHPQTDKEYYLGAQTGDDACLVCGETWLRTPKSAAGGTTESPS